MVLSLPATRGGRSSAVRKPGVQCRPRILTGSLLRSSDLDGVFRDAALKANTQERQPNTTTAMRRCSPAQRRAAEIVLRVPQLAACCTKIRAALACLRTRYVTPGAGVAPSALADWDIQELLERKPAAPFPARVAVVRVQAPGYRSYSNESYGDGRYSVITTRDVERDEHFARIRRLPMVADVAPLNRLIISPKLRSDRELRRAAAAIKTDLLLIYTFDTSFRIKDHDIGPLGAITLGFLPNKEAIVTTTASAAIYDVRTGFIYGLAEATARKSQLASVWTSDDAVDDSRQRSETEAFERLLDNFEKTWKGVVDEYAHRPVAAAGDT